MLLTVAGERACAVLLVWMALSLFAAHIIVRWITRGLSVLMLGRCVLHVQMFCDNRSYNHSFAVYLVAAVLATTSLCMMWCNNVVRYIAFGVINHEDT